MRKRELDRIRKELNRRRNELLGQAHDPGDVASQEVNQAFKIRLREREQKLLKKVDSALQRVDDGSFGICDDCGEGIELKRLLARPVTTLCIECKSRQEEEEK